MSMKTKPLAQGGGTLKRNLGLWAIVGLGLGYMTPTVVFDTFGMVVLEAMAAGLPVVISSNVGARDLVRDGEEGFVVRRDRNVESVGAALKSLLDPENRRRMGSHARLTASRHDWRLVAARIGGIYRARAALRIGSSAPCPGVPSDRAS